MALTLQLPQDLETQLEREAARLGQDLSEYVTDKLSASAASTTAQQSESLMLFGIIHSLAQRTFALEAVARRQGAGNLDKEELLTIVLREVELYRNSVMNFLGALDREAQLKVRRSPVDLVPLVRSVVDLFEFAAQEKGVEIEFRYESTPEIVLSLDCELTRRLLVNVVDNAVKYSFAKAEYGVRRFIGIGVRRHNIRGDYALSIDSYGVGILGEELRCGHIFEYGVRGMLAADRDRTGSGIGLAEAKRIIEAHHGHIEIRSIPIDPAGGGSAYLTTVTLVFTRS